MGRFRASTISLALLFTSIIAQPHQAAAASQITTCTDLTTGKIGLLNSKLKSCRSYQSSAIWTLQSTAGNLASANAKITVCTSKRSQFTYQIIKSQCAKHQNTSIYTRTIKVPPAPIIKSVLARAADSVAIAIVNDAGNHDLSSPVSYYIVTNLVTQKSEKVIPTNQGLLYLNGLSHSSTYSFQVLAVNADGMSLPSENSPDVKTLSLPQTQSTQQNVARYAVGERGPGGGIIFYVASAPFTSEGSSCNTQCRYLEVAPSTWQRGVSEEDYTYAWSLNTSVATEQDRTTPGTEGRVSERSLEKANWRIGAGFNNTRVMKVAGAQSDAQAAVLAYGGNDSSVGQWFIPSLNEMNELCKFVRGQGTGDPSVACTSSGSINSSLDLNPAAGGFGEAIYWTSSERDASRAWLFNLTGGRGAQSSSKFFDIQIRPIRAL